MVRAGVRGPRLPPAVAGSESAKPGIPGEQEDVFDLGQIIGELGGRVKQQRLGFAAVNGRDVTPPGRGA
jgi:hypothetical protein